MGWGVRVDRKEHEVQSFRAHLVARADPGTSPELVDGQRTKEHTDIQVDLIKRGGKRK